ncbi:hypothetical protein NAPIS_ORF00616 [Vairimorpha apis BRL 01]|uniref:Uncharacterized protein n=1 Tax=Vairimorpha apis BRL 01 TaxID=1037528 RepID=T0MLB2_9MICR|nr:hypothetical protein NAPIS_ORF00616 [Vairimorpha apis BRL 01]
MIFCEICHTKFKCINGEYICQEGHISQTKLEIADDIHVSSRTYICSPLIEYNKQFFRQFVPEINEFFEKVLFVLCIKKTEKVEKYFKKYIKLRDLNSTIFVPEEEICKYLYLFNQHEKLFRRNKIESRFNKNIRETISKPAFGSKNIFSVPCYEYGLQNDFYYSNFYDRI